MSPAPPPGKAARRPRVVVVGGGIAGLAAAWELIGGSGGGAGPDAPEVTVLEAGSELGGKLRTADFAGRRVDTGPDGFLGRRDEAAALAREVGLGERLRPVGAQGASVWAGHRLYPLPEGLQLGVPTRFWPLARSGILGARGTARLAVDVVAPRADTRRPLGDRAIGPLIARKLGHRVVDRLADPLIGGIHAGSVSDMSTAAVFPTLLAVAQRRGSFMKALRRTTEAEERARAAAREAAEEAGESAPSTGTPESGQPPLFWAIEGGVATLPEALGAALRDRGATVRTGSPVTALRASAPGWVVDTPGGPVEADGVVLATPAPVSAGLLAPHDADAARLLRDIDYASVTLVTLAYPASAVTTELYGTGALVPRNSVIDRAAGTEALMTACTFLSQKWPHLACPDEVLLRASVGRMGDDRHLALSDRQLVEQVAGELAALVGMEGAPVRSLVTRWAGALPQYRVNHLVRVTGVEAAVERLGAVAVAGAAYRGVGIPACIASGRAAARKVADALSSVLSP